MEQIDIYNEPIKKEIEEALIGEDVVKIWGIISSLDGNDTFLKVKEKIKNGILLKFDIRAITKGEYQRKPAFRVVDIRRKTRVWIEDFDDEIEARIKLAKDILRDIYDDSFDNQSEDIGEE